MSGFLRRVLPLALLLATTATRAGHAWADESPDALAQHFLDNDAFGFEGGDLKARLDVIDADGKTQERVFHAISKRGGDRQVKSVIRFTAPATMAGTAFLMIQHAGAPNEQYVYLPRMKSTRRVGGAGEKDGSFMGSDFTYADLERRELRDATWSRRPDEPIGKDACYVLAAAPREPRSYSNVVVWMRQKDSMPLRIQFFGNDGALDKTLFTRKIALYDGKPVVVDLHVENARTHHQTDLFVDDLRFRSDLEDSLFTPSALDR